MTLTSDETLSIDSFGPLPRLAPHSVDLVAGCVEQAQAEGKAIYPVGGQTMLGLGCIPSRPGYVLDTTRLTEVDDYPARDMTITVQTGITIDGLNALLARENQRLPVDIPFPNHATLGGAIAANASGQRRFGLGTLRDYVIGIQAVNDRGEIVKAGGRVVKNVAGYDFMKLFTGSLGTLAVLTQVTLKLKPRPEASRYLVVPGTLLDIPPLLDRLRTTRTRPVAMELLNPTAASVLLGGIGQFDEIHRPLVLLFEDNSAATAWQIEQIRKELPAGLGKKAIEPDAAHAEQLNAALRDFPLAGAAKLRFKIMVKASDTWNSFQELSTLNPRPLLKAHLGNGILHGSFEPTLKEDAATVVVERLKKIANETGGNFTLTECPTEWKKRFPVWGQPSSDQEMMKRIKKELDPHGCFNPGRFVV